MSAIIGIYHFDDRPADPKILEQMVNRLMHRGPDGAGLWNSKNVGLGHQKHSTTPESLKVQFPLQSLRYPLTITADARIDNREELARLLDIHDIDGVSQTTICDEELILMAYEKWGESCPEKLLGDFAFAIYDMREKKIFCARDHMGIKPFYYHLSDHLFLFASEIKALFCHPETPQNLNDERIADYLAVNFEDKASTFYQNIYRLPPGCFMTVSGDGAKVKSYWSLDPEKEIRLKSDEEYAEEFKAIFIDSVKCRIRRCRPIGYLLSGGLDSSSVVSVAHSLNKKSGAGEMNAFSATFPDFPQVDEQQFIDIVLQLGGINSYTLRADKISPLQDLEQVYKCEDEPFHMPNLYIYWALAKAAMDKNVEVMIDGIDGDTTVSHGLEYLRDLLIRGKWRGLASEVRWLSKRFHLPGWRFLWHFSILPVLSEMMRYTWSLASRKGYSDSLKIPSTINLAFARRIAWKQRLHGQLEERMAPVFSLKRQHWLSLTSGLLPFTMEVNDKAAAEFGIDHRHPFFDYRLVEFCYAIPSDQKLNRGWDRVVQRRAMKDILPDKILWRIKKSRWDPNFKRGLFEFDKTKIEDAIYKKADVIEAYIDINALRDSYGRCKSGRISLVDGMNVWTGVTLALWLEQVS